MADQAPADQLYPITVLIDELRCEDLQKRISAVKNLQTISIALGQERTRNELLPYIMDLMDDEEQVLAHLADTLDGSYLEFIGGNLYAPHLLKVLERLSEVEETVVRDKAVKSIKNILSMINVKDFKQQIILMIERLMNGETYASKLSAIQLFPVIYQHLSASHQKDIINLFTQTAKDEIPQVRKCSSIVL
jgi:serine/threonine-protein phosphatase 2A regulatory subunit A